MSCLLARHKGVDCTQAWHHLSDAFIEELFEIMSGLGISIDGRSKFELERLIGEAVKFISGHAARNLARKHAP